MYMLYIYICHQRDRVFRPPARRSSLFHGQYVPKSNVVVNAGFSAAPSGASGRVGDKRQSPVSPQAQRELKAARPGGGSAGGLSSSACEGSTPIPRYCIGGATDGDDPSTLDISAQPETTGPGSTASSPREGGGDGSPTIRRLG